jgi:hypothetical protein
MIGRQGTGSFQIDEKGILIFGGYTGRGYTNESYYINV